MSTERRRTRLSLRMRLTATYTVVIVVTGFGVLLAVAIVLALIPGYNFENGPYPRGDIGTPSITVHSKRDVLVLLGFVAVPVLVFLGALGAVASWFIAGRALKPLTEIVATARKLDGTSLDSRIALPGPHDEVRILADTIDGMLDRLQTAFAAQSRFAANVSHELRTPLATMKTLLQVAAKAPPADPRELISRLAITNGRTIEITQALLDLASSEETTALERTPLPGIVRDELAELDQPLEEARIVVDVSLDDCTVWGHPVLLRLLVRNLLQNAVRHNRANGSLIVRLERRADGVTLEVSNSGSIIEPDVVPLLTEAFYRSNLRTASGAATGGHGLGLALVTTIADTLQARLAIRAGSPDGLSVTVDFDEATASSP